MSRDINEADWKAFRRLQTVALERACERVLSELVRIAADAGKEGHARYREVYKLIQDRDAEIAAAFNNPRRSTALWQLARIRAMGLLNDEEFEQFSEEMRSRVDALASLGQ